jgi:hypothetical protein
MARGLDAAGAVDDDQVADVVVRFPRFCGGISYKSLVSSVDEARSGLKMGVRSPVDVVTPWSVQAVYKSGAGSCAVGPSVLP